MPYLFKVFVDDFLKQHYKSKN